MREPSSTRKKVVKVKPSGFGFKLKLSCGHWKVFEYGYRIPRMTRCAECEKEKDDGNA